MVAVYKSVYEWSLEFRSIIVPDEFQSLLLCASQFSQSVIEDIENFISHYDKRINEAVQGIGEESKKKTLSFSFTLRGFDVSKLESEIENIRNLLL